MPRRSYSLMKIIVGIVLGLTLLAVLLPIGAIMYHRFERSLGPPLEAPDFRALPFPEYPGARLVGEEDYSPSSFVRTYITSADRDEVIRFYREKLAVHGWKDRGQGPATLHYSYFDSRADLYRSSIFITGNGGETEIRATIEFVPPM